MCSEDIGMEYLLKMNHFFSVKIVEIKVKMINYFMQKVEKHLFYKTFYMIFFQKFKSFTLTRSAMYFNACFLITRFFNLVFLLRVCDDIAEYKRLNYYLYMASLSWIVFLIFFLVYFLHILEIAKYTASYQ